MTKTQVRPAIAKRMPDTRGLAENIKALTV